MRFDVYVNYPGCCEEAFRFYERHLGASLESLAKHGEQPRPGLPPEWGDRVLHARLRIGNATLMGADIPGAEPMRSAYLTLSVDSDEEAERVYAVLSEQGEVFMAMMETPFARRFAMLRDRFGASWMILHQDR